MAETEDVDKQLLKIHALLTMRARRSALPEKRLTKQQKGVDRCVRSWRAAGWSDAMIQSQLAALEDELQAAIEAAKPKRGDGRRAAKDDQRS